MLFYLVSRISKKRALGLLVVFLYVFDFAAYSGGLSILTDTPFSALLIFSFFLLYRYICKKKLRYVVLCFLALNYAVLVRPQIMYFNIVLTVLLLVLAIVKKVCWKVATSYLLIFGIFLADGLPAMHTTMESQCSAQFCISIILIIMLLWSMNRKRMSRMKKPGL